MSFFLFQHSPQKPWKHTIFETLENMAHYGFVFTSDRQCFVLFKWRYTVSLLCPSSSSFINPKSAAKSLKLQRFQAIKKAISLTPFRNGVRVDKREVLPDTTFNFYVHLNFESARPSDRALLVTVSNWK